MKKAKKRFTLKRNVEIAIVMIVIILTMIAATCGVCYLITGNCNSYLALGCMVICYMLTCILDKYGREN